MDFPVLIVGGGIGGLCTALALGAHGIPTIVFERNRFEDSSGAGIQLSPNATRLLFHIGLGEDLLVNSVTATEVLTRNWQTGRVTSRLPLGEIVEKRCGFPYIQVLRSRLIRVLLRRVHSNSNIQLRPEDEVHGLSSSLGHVTLKSESGQYRGTLVVGADGMRSKVRSLMGVEYLPPYSGWVAWRTIVQDTEIVSLLGAETNVWCGPHGHIVHYPIDKTGSLNCVFITKSPKALNDSWRQQGCVSQLRQLFSDWHKDVARLIDAIEEPNLFRWGLFRHHQLPGGWTRQHIALLGDACHCVLPFLAQGAALAIEDAFTLAQCLSVDYKNPNRAIAKYEHERIKRAERVQRYSELMGMAYHLPQPWSKLRDLGSKVGLHQLTQSVYRYNALAPLRQG